MSSIQSEWWSTETVLLTKPGTMFQQYRSQLRDQQCIGLLFMFEFKLRELARLKEDHANFARRLTTLDLEVEAIQNELQALNNDHVNESSVSSFIPEQDCISKESLDDVSSKLNTTSSNLSTQDGHVILDASMTSVTPSCVANHSLTVETTVLNTSSSTDGDATSAMNATTSSVMHKEVTSINTQVSNPITEILVPTTTMCDEVTFTKLGSPNPLETPMTSLIIHPSTHPCKKVASTDVISLMTDPDTSTSPVDLKASHHTPMTTPPPPPPTTTTTTTMTPFISNPLNEVPTLTTIPSTPPTGSDMCVHLETSSPNLTAVSIASIPTPLCSPSSPSISSLYTALPNVTESVQSKRKSRFRFPSFLKLKKFFSSLKFKH